MRCLALGLVLVGCVGPGAKLGRIEVAVAADETYLLVHDGSIVGEGEHVPAGSLHLIHGHPGAWETSTVVSTLRGSDAETRMPHYRLVFAGGAPLVVIAGSNETRILRVAGAELVALPTGTIAAPLCEAWTGSDGTARVLAGATLYELSSTSITRQTPSTLPCREGFIPTSDNDGVVVEALSDGCGPCPERSANVRLADGTPARVTLRYLRPRKSYVPRIVTPTATFELEIDNVFYVGAAATADGLVVATLTYDGVLELHRIAWSGTAFTMGTRSVIERQVETTAVSIRIGVTTDHLGNVYVAWPTSGNAIRLATITPSSYVARDTIPFER